MTHGWFDLRYENGVIRDLGALEPRVGERVLDLGGAHLCAGLVDAHVHLSLGGTRQHVGPGPVPVVSASSSSPSPSPSSRDDVERGAADGAAAVNAMAHMAHGVTAVRDLGGRAGPARVGHDEGAAPSAPGRSAGGLPRVVSSTGALTSRGHYGGFLGVALGPTDDPAQAVRGRVAAGARVVKVILTGSVDLARGTVAPPHFSFAELQKMTDAAHELGVPVAVHANGADAVRMAAEAGADSIEHGILLDADAVDVLAEHDVVWVPTLTPLHALAAQAHTRDGSEAGVGGPRGPRASTVGDERAGDLAALPRIIAEHEAMVATARAAGVSIAAGTDGGSPGVPHGALLTEVAHLRAAGLSPAEVRDAACAVGADLLGLGGGYGRLRIGAATDLVWFEHDPFGDPPTDDGRTAHPLGVLMGPPMGS